MTMLVSATTIGLSDNAAVASTRYVDLGEVSGVLDSFAVDVNDHVFVIGMSRKNQGESHEPTVWDRGGRRTVLPDLPDNAGSTYPKAINGRNETIGRAPTTDGRIHAVRWTSDHRIIDMEFLPGTTGLEANAIGADGTVIGYAMPGMRPARWDRTGRVSELTGPPGLRNITATAVNDHGLIAGYGFGEGWRTQPLLWNSSGEMRALALPSGITTAVAAGLNNRGTVVGGSGDFALLWDRGGRPTVLPNLSGETSYATAINERGTVLGYSSAPSGTTAVRWIRGRISRLELPSGSTSTGAYRQNNHDIVVGGAIMGPRQDVPVWWDRDGAAHTLDCPPGTYSCVVESVNDHGIAVGHAFVISQEGGTSHALLWKLGR
ncbi:hypothetical protein [Amycolatopsis regifaucium]|uniref:hypothetical protein n=1 Tax=Amycolatopsis regifaucium TaxID=546365 RepID=UPI0011603EE1|nr:hypothetical protein [Amycolatopsis regifaucium]